MKLSSYFSGVGAYEKALQKLNIEYELVNYSEFDKTASKAYSIIHNVNEELNLGDITKIDETKVPNFDLMTYSFPCQDLSMLGKMKGLTDQDGNKTRSGLFFDAMRIAKHKQPKYMIAENVRSLAGKKFKNDFIHMIKELDYIGYNTYYKVLNTKDYGIPHSRNRIFIVSIRKDIDDGLFEFPKPFELSKKASDFYDDGIIDRDFYVPERFEYTYNDFRLKKKFSSINADIIICQTTKQGIIPNPQNFVKDEKGVRILTHREMFALQGFSKTDAEKLMNAGLSRNQIGKLAGNTVTVDVLVHIFKQLLKVI